MNEIVAFFDQLYLLSPILPPVAKFGAIVLICLIAFIPVSLIAWTISRGFSPGLNALVISLGKFAGYFFDLSEKLNNRIGELMDEFYSSYITVVSFDSPKFYLSGHPVQEAIDRFERDLSQAPTLASDREAHKTQLIEELNNSLNQLGSGIESANELSIPELELDKGVSMKKRSAIAKLFISVPFLVAVIIVNTALLNTFFEDIFDDREFYGMSYAIIIACMFTLIEAGIGMILGYQERETTGRRKLSGELVIIIFGWFIVFALALVEFVLYLYVGTSENIDAEVLLEMALDKKVLEIFLAGGWLSFLGPAIVAALFGFGHFVSTAYFDFSQQSDLERFKRDLDKRFNIFQSMRDGVDAVSARVQELIQKIRAENIELNQAESSSSDQLSKFKDTLDANLGAINSAIASAENIDVPPPEIETETLSRQDTEAFHRTNILYLAMFFASLFIMTLALPIDLQILGMKTSFFGDEILLSLILNALACFSGISLISKVNVVQTSDEKLAKVVLEKTSILNIIISVIVGVLTLFLLWNVFDGAGVFENSIPFVICVICLIASFIVGRKLLQAIGAWFAFLKAAWLKLQVFCLSLLGSIAVSLGKLVSIIVPILDGLAFPVKFLARRS